MEQNGNAYDRDDYNSSLHFVQLNLKQSDCFENVFQCQLIR